MTPGPAGQCRILVWSKRVYASGWIQTGIVRIKMFPVCPRGLPVSAVELSFALPGYLRCSGTVLLGTLPAHGLSLGPSLPCFFPKSYIAGFLK